MINEWREVTVKWEGDDNYIGRNSRGGTVNINSGGEKQGIGPMELLLLGVAGCTAMDVISILKKKRQSIDDLRIRVCGKRAETYPMVYTEIEVTYYLWGENLSQKAVEQAIQLSEEKYCSASAMLKVVARFRSSYQLLKPGEKPSE
jgi:putative redox protein